MDYNPMSGWSGEIELREANGYLRAFRTKDGREIYIPKFPEPGTNVSEWLEYLSIDCLEAARQYYQDKWTWDDASDKYRVLVAYIASELDSRISQTAMSAGQARTILDILKNRRNG